LATSGHGSETSFSFPFSSSGLSFSSSTSSFVLGWGSRRSARWKRDERRKQVTGISLVPPEKRTTTKDDDDDEEEYEDENG
jgi:hypothetical protein